MRSPILVALALLLLPTTLYAADSPPRQRLSLDRGWRFHLGDPADVDPRTFDAVEAAPGTPVRGDDFDGQVSAAKAKPDDFERDAELAKRRIDPVATNVGGTLPVVAADYDDRQWSPVTLPHDWAVALPFDPHGDVSHGFKRMGGSLGNDVGWYRRRFDLPAQDKGMCLFVEFDGVYRNCLVWLNGRCLGRNVSGYTGFAYDVSAAANYGGPNELVVRVDAGQPEGWWYEGAGIYRHVWLTKTHALHLVRAQTVVTTGLVNDDGKVTGLCRTVIRNESDVRMTGRCDVDADRSEPRPRPEKLTVNLTFAASETLDIPAHGQATVLLPIELSNVAVWSTDHPNLYAADVELSSGQVMDHLSIPFGVRTIKFDPDHGFFLNGQHVQLQGTCNHQDHAGVGVAVPDAVDVWRLQQLKAMGCNAIRTSHNDPTPELLDACDRLGILVMDEHRKSGRTPKELDDLARLVKRDRNHPSVILWSIGNEEGWIQGSPVGATVAKAMRDTIEQLDPTRPVTAAMNNGWGGGFSTVIDAQGFNYPLNTDVDAYHKLHPSQPLFGSEEGSTVGTRGEYANDPAKGYVSAFDTEAPSWACTAERWVQHYRDRPFMAGAFVWTGFDYRGEPTPYAWPCVNSHFGILDTCGFPKDNFYYYQSVWTDKPMVHLLPHWNWAGKEGQEVDVWAYSNAAEVELLLDGRSLGRDVMPPAGHLSWTVPYHPGTLTARAYRNNVLVASDTVATAGPAATVVLTPDRATVNADGDDVVIVKAAVTDAAGRVVPTAGNLIRFTVAGGTNLGVGNGDPSCHEPDQADQRSAFNGLCCLLVRAGDKPGPITVTATADGLTAGTVTIKATVAPPRPAVP